MALQRVRRYTRIVTKRGRSKVAIIALVVLALAMLSRLILMLLA